MTDFRRPISAGAVCALLTMSFPSGANSQVARDESRPSPICEAIVSDDVDRAIQLVKEGEDVNAGSGCALFAAAQRGQLELVKLLLDHKADPNPRISGDLTVIMGASTPLKAAVISGKVEMVQLLLERGANPRDDFEAFSVVLNFGDVEMAELLLSHGANPNMTHPVEGIVFADQRVSERESLQVTVPRRDLKPNRIDDTLKRWQCSLSTFDGESLLYSAVSVGSPGTEDGRERIVKLLIGRGADLNAKTLNGETPLMNAASQHNHGIMTMLLDAGADAKARDRCGRTAEDYAVLYPHLQLANLDPQTKAVLQEREQQTKALLEGRRREYTGPNGVLSMTVPRAPNLAGLPYEVTALDTKGDMQYDKVMFHVDDFGEYLVVGARVMPPAGVSDMDRDDPQTVLRNISEAALMGWRTDLGGLPEIARESSLDTKYGNALMRVYRVKKGSLLVKAEGRRPTRDDAFDTNIASIVARQGSLVVFVLAENDASADDGKLVESMATQLFQDIRVSASR